MVLGLFPIPPGSVRHLPRTTVLHGRTCHTSILLISGVCCGPSEEGRAQHVGIMDRALLVRQIADTVATGGLFARQLEDPLARALCNVQKPVGPGHFEGLDVGLTNQARPHNNRIILRETATTRDVVKAIAPTDRKSTRLNSSHITISYAVFCLKKKKKH